MEKFKTILISLAVGTAATLIALWLYDKYRMKQLENASKPAAVETK